MRISGVLLHVKAYIAQGLPIKNFISEYGQGDTRRKFTAFQKAVASKHDRHMMLVIIVTLLPHNCIDLQTIFSIAICVVRNSSSDVNDQRSILRNSSRTKYQREEAD